MERHITINIKQLLLSLAIATALLIALANVVRIMKPVEMPVATELQWSSDSSWVKGGWE